MVASQTCSILAQLSTIRKVRVQDECRADLLAVYLDRVLLQQRSLQEGRAASAAGHAECLHARMQVEPMVSSCGYRL